MIIKRDGYTSTYEIIELEIIKNNDKLNNIEDEIFKQNMEKFINVNEVTISKKYLETKLVKDKTKLEKQAKNIPNMLLLDLRNKQSKTIRNKQNLEIWLNRTLRNKIEF